ncbi:MAG: hypothetical protein EXS00_01380 [Phycisphaerales bacterium]|nr:hypothetical protein [Phycisphaerales bacterium]
MAKQQSSSQGMSWHHISTAIGAGALILGLALFATVVLPKLRKAAHASGASTVGAVRVAFTRAPAWLGESDIRLLSELAAAEAGPDPGDRQALARAQKALMDSGWFFSVSQVRRASVGELTVDALFAAPFALVCDSDGEHLIAADGRLLPRTYAADSGPAFPRIRGCREPRPDHAGTRWIGADLAAGLELARMIDTQRWRSQIESIEVGGYAEDGQLRMKTRGGCTIEWGHPPGEETPAEVAAVQKLRYLQYFDSSFGKVDGECTGSLDVRTDCVGIR